MLIMAHIIIPVHVKVDKSGKYNPSAVQTAPFEEIFSGSK